MTSKSLTPILICLILVATLIPQAALAAPAGVYHTVTFNVGGEDPFTQQVLNETLVSQPADPAAGEDGIPFLGWYVMNGSVLEPYNFKKILKNDLTLTAKFSDDHYILLFDDGQGVYLDAVEVAKGDALPVENIPVRTDLPIEKGIEYWSLDSDDKENTKVDFNDLDFENNVVVLYPMISDRNVAVFVTNGTIIEPQTNFEPFKVLKPDDPVRVGYNFAGWTVGPESDSGSFNFEDTYVENGTKIYAQWSPKDVNYTVNFWNEKENISGTPGPNDYELVYTVVVENGAKAGSTVTFPINTDPSQWSEADKLYLAGNNNTPVDQTLNFSTMTHSESKTISGSGETIVNVYYTRNIYNVTFDLTRNNTTSTNPKLPAGEIVTAIFPNSATISGNGTTTGTLPEGIFYDPDTPGMFSINVKMGQNTSNIWPQEMTSTNTAVKATNWNGYASVVQTNISKGFINNITHPHNSGSAVVKNSYENYSRTDVRDKTIILGWKNVAYTELRHYYQEVLPGEEDDSGVVAFTGKGADKTVKYYKYYADGTPNNQSSNPSTSARGWPGKEFEGFLSIMNGSEYNGNRINISDYQDIVRDGNSNHYDIYYYMPRLSYDYTLIIGNGMTDESIEKLEQNGFTVEGSTARKTVLYGDEIGTLPADITVQEGYNFKGWYSDDELKDEFTGTIDGSSKMPAHQITVYAKYEGDAYTVTYHDGSDIVDTQQYLNGKFITEHNLTNNQPYNNLTVDPYMPGRGEFLGWFYLLKVGTQTYMVEFPLDIEMTQNYDLYALWDSEEYTVFYYNWNFETNGYDLVEKVTLTAGRNTLATNGKNAPVPTKTGYTFDGWYIHGGEFVQFTAASKVTGDWDVYAEWTQNDYTVTYENGTSQPISNMPVNLSEKHYKDEILIPSDVPESDGMIFSAWEDVEGKTVYHPGDMFELPARNVTLKATWAGIPDSADGDSADGEDESDPTSGGGSNGTGKATVTNRNDGTNIINGAQANESAGFTHESVGSPSGGNWAVANLAAAGAGILIAAGVVASMILKRKDIKVDKFFVVNVLAVVVAVVSGGLFAWGDELGGTMVMTNEWTIYIVLLLVIEVALLLLGNLNLLKMKLSKEDAEKAE
ncbi:hypothetical protein MsAg5_14040 [Methanosarcinaceae archaeon Ag5]|uniref:InlB B-repeat-containing protein n=1 Tax=Methanolapillus africanus TaxID=3028297 RepID=A0AAE4SE80_9EURY|nr:hypothetical protein [Methanosarcinaceae archaeon Ag5]